MVGLGGEKGHLALGRLNCIPVSVAFGTSWVPGHTCVRGKLFGLCRGVSLFPPGWAPALAYWLLPPLFWHRWFCGFSRATWLLQKNSEPPAFTLCPRGLAADQGEGSTMQIMPVTQIPSISKQETKTQRKRLAYIS